MSGVALPGFHNLSSEWLEFNVVLIFDVLRNILRKYSHPIEVIVVVVKEKSITANVLSFLLPTSELARTLAPSSYSLLLILDILYCILGLQEK